MASPAASSRPFYGSFAWAYDLLSERAVASECDHFATILSARGLAADARLLDAGCGTGRYAVELAGRGYRVTGLDASPELLAVARQRPGASTVCFVEAGLVTLPATPPYEAILCRGVLNDVVDDTSRDGAFQAFGRAVVPGGVVVLDVREWEATVERKTREPIHEKTVATPHGTLTFRSETRLDAATRSLLISERHELRSEGGTTAADHEFVMRCWTRDELQRRLTGAGFVAVEYRGGYDPVLAVGATDRLVAIASRA
jgi:SAM-dependent methyltransferase